MVSFKSLLFAAIAGIAFASGAEAHDGPHDDSGVRMRRPRGERPAVRPHLPSAV